MIDWSTTSKLAIITTFLSSEDEILSSEKDIIRPQLKDTGKPDNILEKMMEGKPPQLFDTAGVLSDYAPNNLKDRSLQSSDQPETQSWVHW